MEGSYERSPQVAVVMVPFPAQGHLNPLLHFSYVVASYGIPVHFAGSGTHNKQAKFRLSSWASQNATHIHFHDFQLPDYKSMTLPKPDPSIHWPVHFEPLFDATTYLRQPVSQLLHQLSTKFRRIVLVHDSLMTTTVQDVKSISNAESYVFNPVSAFTIFLGYWGSVQEKPFEVDADIIPECIPSDEGAVSPKIAKFIAHQYQSLGSESGRLYNTSRLVEGQFLNLLEKMSDSDMKHFAIGPLNPIRESMHMGEGEVEVKVEVGRHKCLEWLDKQEKACVIYVAFGSTTSMSQEQSNELGLGLEKSGQKFIWVLRSSDERVDENEVAEGFEERVKDRGMVVRGWAPQLEILGHPATGGFMSHCGWNSCMESMSMGVPLAAWPMHSEQPKNSLLVSKVLRIATIVRDWEDRGELVKSGTIEDAVTRLMASQQGEEMRKRATELGDAIRRSMSDGGACRLEMDSFIAHITKSLELVTRPN